MAGRGDGRNSGVLLVLDSRLRRISSFGLDGRFTGDLALNDGAFGSRPLALLGLDQYGTPVLRIDDTAPRREQVTDTKLGTTFALIALLGSDGALAVLDSIPSRAWALDSLESMEVLLGPRALLAMSGGSFYRLWTGDGIIELTDLSGGAVRRLDTGRRAVSEAELDAERTRRAPWRIEAPVTGRYREMLEYVNNSREALFARLPASDSVGVFDAILGDGDGGVWLRLKDSGADAKAGEEWLHLDESLQWALRLTLPESSRLLKTAGRRLFVVTIDDDDVEALEVWEADP